MKPNYKNWVPKGMVVGFLCGTAATAALLAIVLLTDFLSKTVQLVVRFPLGILLFVLVFASCFLINLYRTFSYDGKRQFAHQIIDWFSDYIHIPDGGVGLDVGCNRAALTISCTKKNSRASMMGLDRWGKECASFSKNLCQSNAVAEGVDKRTTFVQGDACKLDFPDEHFDAVTSNYCYHNIPSQNRQAIILEPLSLLKRGTSLLFTMHSARSNMVTCISWLLSKDMSYEKVEPLDTTDGLFMTPKQASSLGLKGSGLLVAKCCRKCAEKKENPKTVAAQWFSGFYLG